MASDDIKQAWKVPEPTLRRLPWYLAFVKLMKGKGETFISSTQIAKEINVDPSQVAKDLSFVNISGKTRVGYDINALVDVLEDLDRKSTRLNSSHSTSSRMPSSA